MPKAKRISVKCDECNKMFKNEIALTSHKSWHVTSFRAKKTAKFQINFENYQITDCFLVDTETMLGGPNPKPRDNPSNTKSH